MFTLLPIDCRRVELKRASARTHTYVVAAICASTEEHNLRQTVNAVSDANRHERVGEWEREGGERETVRE